MNDPRILQVLTMLIMPEGPTGADANVGRSLTMNNAQLHRLTLLFHNRLSMLPRQGTEPMQTDVPPRPAEPETKRQADQPEPEPMATEESEDAKAVKERKANAVAEKEKGYVRVWPPHIF